MIRDLCRQKQRKVKEGDKGATNGVDEMRPAEPEFLRYGPSGQKCLLVARHPPRKRVVDWTKVLVIACS